MEHLRARALGAGGIGAQNRRKRSVVEVAISGFPKNAVAGQKAENSI